MLSVKTCISFLIGFLLLVPRSITAAENDGYEMVSRNREENITLYSKKLEGLYRGFKMDFKGGTYTNPFWNNETNPTYAPQIYYTDINHDHKKELIIILTTGYGTGVLLEEIHVFHIINNELFEVLVDNPLAVVYKNVRTKLSNVEAEIRTREKNYKVDIAPVESKHGNLFDDVAFGSIVDYEVIHNTLMVRLSGQISDAGFLGDIVMGYAYKNNMYQVKTIQFYNSIKQNPFYGPM